MEHMPLNHVGHRLEPAMRVGRKAGNVVLGLVGTEFVQHQERVQANILVLADGAPDAYTGTVGSLQGRDDLFDGS